MRWLIVLSLAKQARIGRAGTLRAELPSFSGGFDCKKETGIDLLPSSPDPLDSWY